MIKNLIKRFYRKYFKSQPNFTITYETTIERHGSDYGGWNILKNSLNNNSIVYSFGIGEDISFDLSIINKYQCKIFAFDPTPKVKDWLEKQTLPLNFLFEQKGLADHDGEIAIYEPLISKNISHTSINLGNSKKLHVPCKKLSTLLISLNHSKIDLLKMDIEGFEYSVIDNLLEGKVRPKQLLIEFHHFYKEYGNHKTEEYIKKLENNGYRLFNVSDTFCEYSFLYHN